MAEAIAVVGIAGSVAQFIDIGWRLVHRINEYHSQSQGIPGIYREISAQLPLMIEICDIE
jgi:hypothetical protein